MSQDKSADRPAGVRVVADRNGRAFRRIGMGNRKPPAVTLASVTKSVTRSTDYATRRAEADAADAARAKAIRKLLKPRRIDDSGPTELTRIKHQPSSFERMLTAGQVTGEQYQAAQEIEQIIYALTGSLIARGFKIERQVKATRAQMAERTAWAHAKRYVPWANELSRLKTTTGDPSLDIVVSILVDRESCFSCDRRHRIGSGKSNLLFRRALLLYAQMAGWAPSESLDKFDAEHGVSWRRRR